MPKRKKKGVNPLFVIAAIVIVVILIQSRNSTTVEAQESTVNQSTYIDALLSNKEIATQNLADKLKELQTLKERARDPEDILTIDQALGRDDVAIPEIVRKKREFAQKQLDDIEILSDDIAKRKDRLDKINKSLEDVNKANFVNYRKEMSELIEYYSKKLKSYNKDLERLRGQADTMRQEALRNNKMIIKTAESGSNIVITGTEWVDKELEKQHRRITDQAKVAEKRITNLTEKIDDAASRVKATLSQKELALLNKTAKLSGARSLITKFRLKQSLRKLGKIGIMALPVFIIGMTQPEFTPDSSPDTGADPSDYGINP